MFLVLYRFAGRASFWLDELFSLGSIRSSWTFSDTMNYYIHDDIASPLYYFIAYFWYRIVPHTQQALLSLSIIFTTLAAIIMGVIGKKLSGVRVGFFAFIFFLLSSSVIWGASYEFRHYSFLVFAVAINIYFYLSRLENENWKNILLYGITMCLLPYTHYVSVLLCFGFFIADLCLIGRKRAGICVVASYFIGALLFVPWLLLMIPEMGHWTKFWPSVPTFTALVKTAALWTTGSASFYSVFLWLAVAGFAYIAGRINRNTPEINFMGAGYFASTFMFLSAYIYSKYINPEGSFFVYHYFFPTVPFAVLSMAYGADVVYRAGSSINKRKTVMIFSLVIAFMFCHRSISLSRDTSSQHWKEIADLIYRYEQSYSGKSIILSTAPRSVYEGWKEFYLTADYTRESANALLSGEEGTLDKLKSERYERIYLCYPHVSFSRIPKEIQEWLYAEYNFSDEIDECEFRLLELKR